MAGRKNIKKDFWQAYEAYADALFRHCYFRMYDRELARDLVQEAFCRVWAYMADGNEVQNTRALLYRTLHNLIVDEVRRKKPIPIETIEEIGEPTNLPEMVANTLAAEEVMKLVDKLDAKYREFIIMNFVDGLSPKEISSVTGASENLVSVRIHRGIKQIRELLGESDVKPEGKKV